MAKLISFLLGMVVAVLGAAVLLLLEDPNTSTLEIERDRSEILRQVSAAEQENAQYSGGLIKVMIAARIETLRTTLAMLDQKRSSFLRRVSLEYRVEGKEIGVASDQELNHIIEDIQQAERNANTARAEASKYSGGLIQVMALSKASTEELSAAQLRMKFYTAKYGMTYPLPQSARDAPAPSGTIVKDRDAL